MRVVLGFSTGLLVIFPRLNYVFIQVLVSIRSLIRNCVHKDLEGDDALKLLPPGLPLELNSMLCTLLQKHKTHWKEELSQEQVTFRGWQRI